MRISKNYSIHAADDYRNKLSYYANAFSTFALLDSCNNDVYGKPQFNYLLAAGAHKVLAQNSGDAFNALKQFVDLHGDWCFGFLGYDLKNETEVLYSKNDDGIGFQDMVFFVPEILISVVGNIVSISVLADSGVTCDSIFDLTIKAEYVPFAPALNPLQARIPEERYLQKVRDILHHIAEGDIYELNFCQEFYTSGSLDAIGIFNSLCALSAAPFSVLFKWENKMLISASPERFLKKVGRKIMSQPIKGTSKRSSLADEDTELKIALRQSIKDRAENVMIVDLVRNDLTKVAQTGSIAVDELFAIYTFNQVHHMISTISAVLRDDVHAVDAIKAAFPMGSMTGAPKVMAMELIEKYEATKRGLFSGAFGYITPNLDFDFNVVIRSIQYNLETQYVSVQTGGAIVYDSIPEAELAECFLKLAALKQVLFPKG